MSAVCCQPVEHFVPLDEMRHPGFVLLLLELLQSLVDALTEEPEIRAQYGRKGEGRGPSCLVEHRLPGDSSVAGFPWEMIPTTF